MEAQELYELDFFEWTRAQAELLGQGCLASADIPHIAEELADMGERDRREVRSGLRRLMMHLMKWQFQPDRRSTSWRARVADSRAELEDIFEPSPSLWRLAAESFRQIYPRARRQASVETGLPQSAFPTQCPYSFDQLMDDDFFPSDEPRASRE